MYVAGEAAGERELDGAEVHCDEASARRPASYSSFAERAAFEPEREAWPESIASRRKTPILLKRGGRTMRRPTGTGSARDRSSLLHLSIVNQANHNNRMASIFRDYAI